MHQQQPHGVALPVAGRPVQRRVAFSVCQGHILPSPRHKGGVRPVKVKRRQRSPSQRRRTAPASIRAFTTSV